MTKNLEMYIAQMREIKLRVNSIELLLNKTATTGYRATNIESIYLQIRKILELISLASLSVNVREYQKAYNRYAKDWKANLILKDIERINKDFYPQPIIEAAPTVAGTKSTFVPKSASEYLTRKEFEDLYTICGKILHSTNPFGPPINYEYYHNTAHTWLIKIISLLNSHKIKLINDPHMYLVQMRQASDEDVHITEWTRTPYLPCSISQPEDLLAPQKPRRSYQAI